MEGILHHRLTTERVSTGPTGWIFVLQDGLLYAGKKETESKPRLHHTSFVAGECVQAAGMMVVDNGHLTKLYPHSGHYRPSEDEVRVLLFFLRDHKVDLDKVLVDIQRVQKLCRDSKLVKKTDSATFWNGTELLNFLCCKNDAWTSHLFDELIETCKTRHRLNN